MTIEKRVLSTIFANMFAQKDMKYVGDYLFVELNKNRILKANIYYHCEYNVAIGFMIFIYHKDNGKIFEQLFSFKEFGLYAEYGSFGWRNPGLSKKEFKPTEEELDRIRKPLWELIEMWM